MIFFQQTPVTYPLDPVVQRFLSGNFYNFCAALEIPGACLRWCMLGFSSTSPWYSVTAVVNGLYIVPISIDCLSYKFWYLQTIFLLTVVFANFQLDTLQGGPLLVIHGTITPIVKWPYKWVIGVITLLIIEVITPFVTGDWGPACSTPWKINMEPINHPFRKENDLPNLHDSMIIFHVNLPGCNPTPNPQQKSRLKTPNQQMFKPNTSPAVEALQALQVQSNLHPPRGKRQIHSLPKIPSCKWSEITPTWYPKQPFLNGCLVKQQLFM